jgi:hypothetical protein
VRVLGFTPQRPVYLALQRDTALVVEG